MATVWCNPCGAERRNEAAVVNVDGDPMCRACANFIQNEMILSGHGRLPETPIDAKPEPPALCSRGCGKPTHRGQCAGPYAYKPGPRQAKAELPKALPLSVSSAPVVTVCHVPERAAKETRAALGELARAAVDRFSAEAEPQPAPCNGFRVVKRAELPGVARRQNANLNQRVFAAMLEAQPEAVEVPVESWKAGVNLRRRVQLMARAKGLAIDWSRTPDSKLFYFWLVDQAPKVQPAAEVTR